MNRSGPQPGTAPGWPPKPRRDLSGKVAIVTGAGTRGAGIGNGMATALLLADDGADVLCVDLDKRLAERTVGFIHASREKPGSAAGNSLAWSADVTNEAECEAAVEKALEAFGRLDILINNVGVFGPSGKAPEVDAGAWAKALETNVTSMMLMAKYAIPAMRKNDKDPNRGSIVNLGSVAGLLGGTHSLLYPTSKGAVVNMTRAMAAHHGEDGIRVNCVCPGMLYTPMMYEGGMSMEVREARRERSFLKTEGNAWDCASAVRFLASDEARWITGSVLTVDAGATAAVSLALSSSQ